jgi:hypothetical protein
LRRDLHVADHGRRVADYLDVVPVDRRVIDQERRELTGPRTVRLEGVGVARQAGKPAGRQGVAVVEDDGEGIPRLRGEGHPDFELSRLVTDVETAVGDELGELPRPGAE